MESLEERRLLDCNELAFDASPLFETGGVLDQLQSAVDDATYIGNQIPFVGEQLAGMVPFGVDIRQSLLTVYDEATGAAHERIEHALSEVLGPAHYDLLDQAIDLEFNSETCTITATIDISRTLSAWQLPGFTFDVGLQSLPIYAAADVSGIQLAMGFDLSPFTLSLALDTGAMTLDTDGMTFSLELNASFADDATLSAQVGFLQMQISDGIGASPADNQRSSLAFGAELAFGPGFAPESIQLAGDANLYLHMQTQVNDNLPSIAADFILEYDLTADTQPNVRFENVSVGLGDMVGKLLGPIIDVVQPLIEPLDFATDLLTAPIPLISDLGLGDVSVLQIANALADNGALPPDITAYVKLADVITRVVDFVAMFESNDCVVAGCSEAVINLGELSLSDINGDLRAMESKILNPTVLDANISSLSIGNWADLTDLIDKVNGLDLPNGIKQSLTQGLQDVNDRLNSGVTIELPILDNPGAVVFQWLVGQNADIFRVDAGITLAQSEVDLGGPMPIGINGGLRGGFAPSVHLGLGYDTFGLRRFADNVRHDTNPSAADILEGFYITGDSELSVKGELKAYLELNALVFSVEAAGGVEAGLLAEVIDSSEDPTLPNVDDDSHKVRFASELGPCAFRVSGDVTAGISLSAKLGIELGPIFFGVQHTWDVAQAQIASFDLACVGNPLDPPVDHVLGEVDDNGVLTLYVGALAGQRSIEEMATEEDFSLVATSPDPEGPPPTGQSVRINAFGVSQTVHNVTQIVADMGSSNDKLTVGEGITVPVEVYGGDGNDILRSFGTGATTFFGDDGDDQLFGGAGDSLLFGDDGNDSISAIGNPAADLTIAGGAGDDVIFGGPGENVLEGGDGDDELISGSGNNRAFGGGGHDVIMGGLGILEATGGDGDDVVAWAFGDAPVTFDGESGTDALSMVGSAHPDTFVLTQQGGAIHVAASGTAGLVESLARNVEQVGVDGLGGRDQVLVQPLTGSPIEHLAINLSDNLASDNVEDVISIHGTPLRDELTVENVSATLTELPAHKDKARGGVMRIAGFRSQPLVVDDHYEILAMNQLDRILVNSHDANDLIQVAGVTGPTWIDTDEGDDELEVDATRPPNFSNDTGDFLSEVYLDAGGGSNRLAVSERLSLIADTLEVTDRTVTSLLLPGVHYEARAGGSFGGGISVSASDLDDTLNVSSTRRGAVSTIEGGDGNDDVNVSSHFVLPGGNLNSIHGPLVIDGGSHHTTVALVDTTDANPGPLTTIHSTSVAGVDAVQVSGLAGPDDEVAIQIIDRADQTLRLETSNRPTAHESFLVHGTIQGETIINDQEGDADYRIEATRGPLRIVGQAGDEAILVTPTYQSWTDLAESLTVEAGGGQDRLEISDQSSLELTFYELSANHLTRGPASAGDILFDEQLELIELRTAAGSDTVNVVALPTAQVDIDQGTGNNIIVGPASGADWIIDGADSGSLQGHVDFVHAATIASGGGANTFSILDGGSISGSILGTAAGHDELDFSDVSTPVTINLQDETATAVGAIRHLDEFTGGTENDTLIGRSAANTWTVDGPAQGSVQAADDDEPLEFQSLEQLVGGDLSDLFLVVDAAEALSIMGAAGIDELSYTFFLAPVEVDLQLGTATAIGNIQQIENVHGGAGDDILLGDHLNNVLSGMDGHDILVGRGGHDTLQGGAGNDLLIGGAGADSLSGGDQSDLLIGNATVHDSDTAELTSLQAEWKRQDRTYGRRIRALRDGTGLNTPLQLTPTSILPDLAIDQLFGGDDDDWFWNDGADVLLGLESGEEVN